MKKLSALFTLFLILLTTSISSQWGWFQLNSGTSSNLNDIRFYGQTGYSVGNNGLILKTTNSGQNWVVQPSGTSSNLKSIDISFGYYGSWFGCIAGEGGVILVSTNAAGGWTQVTSGVTSSLNEIFITADTNTLIAAGDNGKILTSFNRGQSWQICSSNTNKNLRGICETGYWFVVGDSGTVLRSFDYGYSWTRFSGGTPNNLNSITRHYSVDVNLVAVGTNGTIIRSSNDGQTWVTTPSGTASNLFSAWSYFNGMGNSEISYFFASGANGTVLISTDSGSTWHGQYIPTSTDLYSINFNSINTGFAVGSNGTIVKTISNHYYIDRKMMNANSISTRYSNDGIFNHKFDTTSKPGFEWPKGSGHYARFGSGLWMGAIVNSDTCVATLQYEENEYYPGFTDQNGIPHGRNDSNYRVYKMTYEQNNPDRTGWPNLLLGNSDQGAPVYFDQNSNSWKPLDFGSETMFYSYTDSYQESHINGFGGGSKPLKADVKQLNFALDVSGPMANTIITQFTIINRGSSAWNNAYFTIWTDDDIGNQYNDKVACDSALSLGYSYNYGSDTAYGSTPPAVGFLLLKGVLNYTGNNFDTVRLCKNKDVVYYPRYKDIGMSSFNYSANGDLYYPDAGSFNQAYNLMKGLRLDGSSHINPYGGFVTNFIYSGNPVSGTGWVQSSSNDVRFYISTGPVNMNPGDTQTIVIAQIIARGTGYLNSITLLKEYALSVKDYYKSCYTSIPIGIQTINEIAYSFKLFQNYPNPFNPVTKIRFNIPAPDGAEGRDVKIVVYDILGKEIMTLVDQRLKPGAYEVEFNGDQLASGAYFYQIVSGSFSETRKMILLK